MADKAFKTIEEQIELLESRGLTVQDQALAQEFLLHNNYYRVSGYSLTLRNNDVFSSKATMDNIIEIYRFDHEMRHLLLKYIEVIEVSVKSIFAYEFSKAKGPFGYLDANNFTDSAQHKRIIEKADEQKEKRHASEAYLKHYMDDLHQDIPLWAYVDLLTISDLSFLYKITEQPIQLSVATTLGLMKKGNELLGHFLHRLTIIRNLCAHGSRLYNRLFEQKPHLSKSEKQLLIVQEDGTVDNAHLYGFVLIMRRLLKPTDFAELKAGLIALTKASPFVDLKYYGFRDDWQTVL